MALYFLKYTLDPLGAIILLPELDPTLIHIFNHCKEIFRKKLSYLIPTISNNRFSLQPDTFDN
jgi:hypothetical protein